MLARVWTDRDARRSPENASLGLALAGRGMSVAVSGLAIADTQTAKPIAKGYAWQISIDTFLFLLSSLSSGPPSEYTDMSYSSEACPQRSRISVH